MNTTSGDNDLDRLLQTTADRDNLRWSESPAPPSLPSDCPTMPRMYEAILRDDLTDAEFEAIGQSPKAQALVEKIEHNVWYPTKIQLFKYSRGLLDGDELKDVRYHLEVDKCKRSLRLYRWMTVDQHMSSLFDRMLHSVSKASGIDRIDDILFGTRQTLRPIPASSGFAPKAQLAQQVQFDNDELTVVLTKEGTSDWLTVESRTHSEATLLRLSLADDEGNPVESRFVVLRQGTEAATARLALSTPVPSNSTVYCLVVHTDDLADSDAMSLRAGFAAVQQEDRECVEAWKKWASAASGAETMEAGIRAAVDDILGE